MAELTPYAYRPGNTPLHRLGAGTKLVALCALSLLAFFGGMPGLAGASALVAAAAFAARLSPGALLSGSKPLLIATGAVVLLRAVSFESALPFLKLDFAGLAAGLVFAWGVIAAFAAGSALFAATTTAELRRALTGAETRLKKAVSPLLPRGARARLYRADLSLALALALAFIPRVFEAWDAAEDAYAARCGRKGVRALWTLLPAVAERLLEAASETAAAMVSRGYEGGGTEPRSERLSGEVPHLD